MAVKSHKIIGNYLSHPSLSQKGKGERECIRRDAREKGKSSCEDKWKAEKLVLGKKRTWGPRDDSARRSERGRGIAMIEGNRKVRRVTAPKQRRVKKGKTLRKGRPREKKDPKAAVFNPIAHIGRNREENSLPSDPLECFEKKDSAS